MQFPEARSYSWVSTVQDDGRFYVVDGKTERDGYTAVNMPMVSAIQRKLSRGYTDTHNAIFKGDSECVIETPQGWKTPAELAALPGKNSEFPPPLSSRSAAALGLANRAPRYSNIQLNLSHPHEEIGLIVGSHVEIQAEKDGVSGTLSEEGAKLLLVHPGQNQITALRASGTFQLWIKNGILVKYEVRLAGTIAIGAGSSRRQIALRQNAVTELGNIDTTELEIPEEAKRKLG